MSVVETVLVFAGIPLAVVLVIAVATLAPSAVRGQTRYRPGRPWTYEAAWWLPEPDAAGAAHAVVEADARSTRAAITDQAVEDAERGGASAADARRAGHRAAEERLDAAVGGASGEW